MSCSQHGKKSPSQVGSVGNVLPNCLQSIDKRVAGGSYLVQVVDVLGGLELDVVPNLVGRVLQVDIRLAVELMPGLLQQRGKVRRREVCEPLPDDDRHLF